MNKIRLRLAPSPTGFLHIGNLRTALFGYLIAKKMDGEFILRIEDTDQKREVKGAVDSLINILDWVGIKFDEGPHLGGNFGPYIQSQRLDIYNKHVDILLKEKKAYRCFCSEERLTKMREEQTEKKQAPKYDRTCRDLSEKEVNEKKTAREKFVIRQKLPLDGEIKVYDEIRGEIKFKANDLEDHVLIKSNGVPTYHFASVVDDHLMEISHVTRGEEWLPSFPKNALLYEAFGWKIPKFIHLPLILNKGGGKLSKRQGDVFVEDYKNKGYLPEAIINFCALLGWHPKKDDKELFSLAELEKAFNLEEIGASPAVFDLEKLDYLNGYYIRQKSSEELINLCLPILKQKVETSLTLKWDIKKAEKAILLEQERIKKLSEVGESTKFLFKENLEYEKELLLWKNLTFEEVKNNLKELIEILNKIEEKNWVLKNIEQIIVNYLKENNKKVGDYLWPMRVVLSGEKNSPSPFEIADILGKKKTLKQINQAIQKI